MEKDIIEKLADNEHNRWANWQKYVHSKCIKNEDGSLTIPKEYVEHWEYEINTKYKDLPENIKESDRKEVTHVLKILDYENLIARYKELEEGKALTKKQEAMILKAIKQSAEEQITKEMKDYIPKSKVQEKIKELNLKLAEDVNGKIDATYNIRFTIQVLGELLVLED